MTSLPSAVPAWLERVQAALLVAGSAYLLAIAQLSPHPIPGLRWLGLVVLAAGLACALRASRWRRAAVAVALLTVACGLAGVGEIAYGMRAPTATHARR